MLFILIVSHVTAATALAAIDFIYPGPSSYVTSSGHLIVKFNQTDLSTVRITHNGVAGDQIDVASPEYRKLFKDFLIAQSSWDAGINTVTVDTFKGGQKTESADLKLFYAERGSQKAPPEFVPTTMHRLEKEVLCQYCHNMYPTPAQMNSSVERNNPCYACHKKMLLVKNVHGPAGTYSCGFCHSSKGNPKHAVARRGAALCYECHADMAGQVKKNKFIHGPVEAGMCDACHDPHGSQNESQLLMPINELCLSCHGHIRGQVHVVATIDGGHPLKGKPDPSKKGSGKEMSCISCHSPHSANVRYFFVNNAEDRMSFCQMCHNK